jgi:hypothetical protein
MRTYEVVEREMRVLRRKRDDYIANGELRLAGGACVEIEELIPELVALRDERPDAED